MCNASAPSSIATTDTITTSSRVTGASFRSNDRVTVGVGDAVVAISGIVVIVIVVTAAIVVSAVAVITAAIAIVVVTATTNTKLTIVTGSEVVVGSGCDDYDVVTAHGLHRTYHRERAIVQYYLKK